MVRKCVVARLLIKGPFARLPLVHTKRVPHSLRQLGAEQLRGIPQNAQNFISSPRVPKSAFLLLLRRRRRLQSAPESCSQNLGKDDWRNVLGFFLDDLL